MTRRGVVGVRPRTSPIIEGAKSPWNIVRHWPRVAPPVTGSLVDRGSVDELAPACVWPACDHPAEILMSEPATGSAPALQLLIFDEFA